MGNWINYGDINYIENGGILLKSTDNPTVFEFVDVSETETELMQAVTGIVDVADYLDKKDEICKRCGFDPKFFENGNMGFACAVVEDIGPFHLNGQPIDLLAGEYNVTKYDLCNWLNDIGFKCKYEYADMLKKADNHVLADYIDDYIYDVGEYEHDDESRLPYIDPEDRANTVDNIEAVLDKGGSVLKNELLAYFEGMTCKENKDIEGFSEYYEKAQIFHDILKERASKERAIERE